VWQIKGLSDFDGDGKNDILWQHRTTGQLFIWLLDGVSTYAELNALNRVGSIIDSMSSVWQIKRLGDFDGDGKSDILWQHRTTGQLFIWLLDGVSTYAELKALNRVGSIISRMGSVWQIKGVSDFDGDGRDDILWQNSSTGQVYIWLLDGVTPFAQLKALNRGGSIADRMGSVWQIKGVSDFDGDGKSDLLWQHSSTGQVYVWLLDGVTPFAQLKVLNRGGSIADVMGSAWKLKGLGDYDGDGKNDVLWQNSNNGQVYVWLLNGVSSFVQLKALNRVGSIVDSMSSLWQIKGMGDYNGDGTNDILWQNSSTGQVFVWLLDGITPYTVLSGNSEVGALNASSEVAAMIEEK